jgi:PAS domain S-box-containing protein
MSTGFLKNRQSKGLIRNKHLWILLVLFLLIVLLNYPQVYAGSSTLAEPVQGYFTIVHILFLLPIIYSGFIFGVRGGIYCLIISLSAMLPQVLISSSDLLIPIAEIFAVIVVGAVINFLFWINRRNLIIDEGASKAIIRIIDGSPVASFVLNSQHKVIHWNTAIEALTGIKREEVIGTSDHRRAFFNTDKKIMADMIIDGASVEEIEARYEGKARKSLLIEGAYDVEDFFPIKQETSGKWLHFTGSPVKDNDGTVIGAIETLEDITERKVMESALRDSESNYRGLFESALEAIWVNDAEGNIQTANESAARLTGYSVKELQQANLRLFISESEIQFSWEIRQKLLQGQQLNRSYEQTVIRKDGLEVVCMLTTNLITRAGEKKAFQTIARDITEAKREFDNQHFYLQEITRAQEEERKRIARELHDSTAQNLIALLHQLENFLDDKTKLPISQAKSLWSFYERIRDILQEVRRFSRDLRPSILDDLGLMPALEWLVEELKSNYGIDASLIKSGEERRLSPEAELLFFRIVQESLTNIQKHSQATKAEIKVEFAPEIFSVTISDNGVGFNPPENIGGLLQSGKLGLAGMAERVQLLGGNIRVASDPGHGTIVSVEARV